MEEEVCDPFHDVGLKESILNFLVTQTLSDVVLVTETKEIQAHKVVLASVSTYFRTHFTTSVGSSTDKNVIKLLEFDSECVEAVVKFIYSGKIYITMGNVFELMDIEEFLQVKNLRGIIYNYLTTAIDKTNCWDILMKAELYRYYTLHDWAFLYILQNFKHVMREQDFLRTPYCVLTKCLDSRVLNVPTEAALLCVSNSIFTFLYSLVFMSNTILPNATIVSYLRLHIDFKLMI